jgi:hypothetical protein
MTQLTIESQVQVDLLDRPFDELTPDQWEQLRLSSLLEEQSQALSEYEIDSDYDPDFGTLYRVWGGDIGINLLGTYYRDCVTLEWVSQPCRTSEKGRHLTPQGAVDAILR